MANVTRKNNLIQWSAVIMLFIGMIGKDIYDGFKERALLPKENRDMVVDVSKKVDRLRIDFDKYTAKKDTTDRAQWRIISKKKDK